MDSAQRHKLAVTEATMPRWFITFADMMTLLLCFFVLLLSFSELDVQRYKQIAGSMAQAFGVQTITSADQIPMGTSVIFREFTPGLDPPRPISEIRNDPSTDSALPDDAAITRMKQDIEALISATQNDAGELADQLQAQISNGEIEIETRGRRIVLRIREKGSFGSGSADLKSAYKGLMKSVRELLARKDGAIQVVGHTDDVPIATARFRSNWELSSTRAVSVAEELLAGDVLDRRRFTVTGYADTRPLVSNDSDDGRSRNRRVEIVIQQGIDPQAREQLQMLKTQDPEYYKSLKIDDQFNLQPSEVF